ncbi:MAG: hypothetical protein IH808_02890 [Proteobacteria bacterium]|nr:hypothetical protein [Pseudomonadota bacterium]
MLITFTHRADLLVEDLRVLLFGVQPVTRLVRLQVSIGQQSDQVTGGNRCDDAACDRFVDDFPLCPARDRAAGFFDGFAGDREDHRELLGGEEGLVLLRGQWVEVDREKLTEALDHWKQVEKQAAGGLSFIDGMRLLAGAPRDLSDEPQQDAADREWSFVDAGNWLGNILTDLRSPENLRQTGPGSDPQATPRECDSKPQGRKQWPRGPRRPKASANPPLQRPAGWHGSRLRPRTRPRP